MQHQWQTFLELLWPSRSDASASQSRRMAFLQVGIALAIALAAGPEIFLAMEMTTLLELLGASLFLTAFATGAKFTVWSSWRAARNTLLPAAEIYVIRSNAAVSAKAQALIYCAINAAWWLAGSLVVGVSARSVIRWAV